MQLAFSIKLSSTIILKPNECVINCLNVRECVCLGGRNTLFSHFFFLLSEDLIDPMATKLLSYSNYILFFKLMNLLLCFLLKLPSMLWVVCWTPDRLSSDRLRSDSISTDRLRSDRLSTDRLRNIGLKTYVWDVKITCIHTKTLVEAF